MSTRGRAPREIREFGVARAMLVSLVMNPSSMVTFLGLSLTSACNSAPTARDVRGAAPGEPVVDEPPARIVVDPPLAGPLAHGRVVIQYRTENLHIAPVFGAAALAVSPRVGHIHVRLDDAAWVWADASGEPVVIGHLPPGAHKVTLALQTAHHHQLDQAELAFVVPPPMTRHGSSAGSPGDGPPGRLVIDPPAAEPLARGVALIPYRAENVRLLPVFGAAALAIMPRVGHVHVTVDHAPWHWVDASGNPVIINGLAAGRHEVLIELVNADHQVIDRGTVVLVIP
jgi:hypothetical protein